MLASQRPQHSIGPYCKAVHIFAACFRDIHVHVIATSVSFCSFLYNRKLVCISCFLCPGCIYFCLVFFPVIIILRNCELLWFLLLLSCHFGAAFSSCVRDCEIRLMCPVTGMPLDFQGYKKCETEQIYFPPKQAEKKKKSKGQSEDISQKVPQFVLRQFHYSSEMRRVSCSSSDTIAHCGEE